MKKRYIVLIVLGSFIPIVAMISGIGWGVTKLMKGEAYALSLENVYANDEVATYLGTPIEAGYFVLGSISTNNGSGTADINYTVEGPNNSARVYVIASKKLGLWTIEDQVVQISESDIRITIVESPSDPESK